MSNNYSLANMSYAIRKLEQEVQGLINERNVAQMQYGYVDDELTNLKKKFEKLNTMLAILQTAAQNLIESGVNYSAWQQSSNVYKNILKPLAEQFYIDKKLQNGLTRTYMGFESVNGKEGTRKIAYQGANTLCADVYELCVIYKNGLAANVIPNKNLITMWNNLRNTLAGVLTLGSTIATSSFMTEQIVNGVTQMLQSGTIGGYQSEESQLEYFCLMMWKLCQSISSQLENYKIGGFVNTFGSNTKVAVNQCSLGLGVSLAPYNTCGEIFNTIQAPLVVACKSDVAPMNSQYDKLRNFTSLFNFNTSTSALLGLYTCWNPFVENMHTLVGIQGNAIDTMWPTGAVSPAVQGVESSATPFTSTGSITIGNDQMGYAFGKVIPELNSFDNSLTLLQYDTPTNIVGGIHARLYFTPTTGKNGTAYADGPNYGEVSGKIIVDGVGFNFVGQYTNNPSANGFSLGDGSIQVGSTTTGLYQLGGRMYYA